MTVVPIRLSRQDARKLDRLVKMGIYRSRTEAIRAMIQVGADERVAKYLMNETVRDALNELLEYEKRDGSNPLRIITRKTAAEIVAEGRQ
ncbi:MAG: ribbon-helix-helix domain-containing protein [Candidatus Bathyarchaeia archaeon]